MVTHRPASSPTHSLVCQEVWDECPEFNGLAQGLAVGGKMETTKKGKRAAKLVDRAGGAAVSSELATQAGRIKNASARLRKMD